MGNKNEPAAKEIDLHINHPHFASAKSLTVNGDQLLRVTAGIDEKEYERWSLSAIPPTKNATHLIAPLRHTFNKAGLCGNAGSAEIYYPNYPYLLHEEIYDRCGKKGDFKEQEIWYLLLSLIEARRQAEDSGQSLNDVRPKNIFLNQEGLIKTATPFSWPLASSKYQKSLDKIATYLAPEEVALLEMGATDFAKVADTAEIFSIGLTLLSVGNLEDYEPLYNLETFKLDHTKLGTALSHWIAKFNYSEVLRATVINLCAEDPARRMTAGELHSLLAKHQESINKKVHFVIDNAPNKLHEEVKQLRAILAQPVGFQPAELVNAHTSYIEKLKQEKLPLLPSEQAGEAEP